MIMHKALSTHWEKNQFGLEEANNVRLNSVLSDLMRKGPKEMSGVRMVGFLATLLSRMNM